MNNVSIPNKTANPERVKPLKLERSRSLWSDSLYRLSRNPGSIIGVIILLTLILMAISAPLITHFNPIAITPEDRLLPPSAVHLMGTDNFGRDTFTRVVFGGRISLSVGIISVFVALLFGVPMGLISGYYGGKLDSVIMRVVDVMLAFPGILLALVIIAILGPSIFNVMIAVGISAIPTYARVTRSSVLKTKEEMFIYAAILMGCKTRRIILSHILPNILGPVVVISTLGIGGAIISGSALSFLGLGATAPTPEWGLLLSDGRNYLAQAWWITTFPGMAIMITVLSINLIGDGLRDALDPKMINR
ncbi:MAG: ABC transporter permease [Anaerolineaceae bacterium]